MCKSTYIPPSLTHRPPNTYGIRAGELVLAGPDLEEKVNDNECMMGDPCLIRVSGVRLQVYNIALIGHILPP